MRFFQPEAIVLLNGADGKVFINCATITPQVHVDVETLAEQAGAKSLEGCMASSITQAREGTLYLMCGGKREVFDDVRPILDSMSTDLKYIGTAGQAAQVKALVNMVMNINTAGLAEGLGAWSGAGPRPGDAPAGVFADGRQFPGAGNRRGGHGGPGPRVLLLIGPRGQGFRHRPGTWQATPGCSCRLRMPPNASYDRMIEIGKGELDKSGVAELTFPGRG